LRNSGSSTVLRRHAWKRAGPAPDPAPGDSQVTASIFGTTTFAVERGSDGTSQRNNAVAAAAPTSCAAMKPGTSAGLMPANVSVSARAIVTAGFANDVDAVNQYAEAM